MECIVLCVSLFCYVYGAITNNVSQVDRLWSILPVVYVWIYALGSNFAPIVVMMAFCVKYSRHPNYFSEVMQWVVIYLWGSYHLGTWKNWGLVFVTVLAILVFCSTFVNEPVSRAKYPLYELYQKGTSRFIPLFPIGYSRFIQAVEKRRQSSVCSHTDQCT